jgi:hypothetical protein
MAKRFYYEVVLQVDLGFWAPDQRKERWEQKGASMIQPTKTLHSKRLYPSRGFDMRGNPLPPDVVVTDRPVAKNYTEETVKRVSRPRFDPMTGRRQGRYFRKKVSPQKLRLMEGDEIDNELRRRAVDLPWTDALYDNSKGDVVLPEDAKIRDSAPRVLPDGTEDDEDAVGAEGITNG